MRILVVFLFIQFGVSQKYIIESIQITGNSGVLEHVVLRELLFKVADSIQINAIEISRKRLESLRLFTSVTASYNLISESERKINVVFEIHEKFNYSFAPLIEFYKNQIEKDSYGILLGDKNFRDENVKFFFMYQNGFRDLFKISYQNPWIRGTDRLGYTLTYINSEEEDIEKENIFYSFNEFEFLFHKGFGPYFTINSGAGKRRLSFIYPEAKILDLVHFHASLVFNNIVDQRFPRENIHIFLAFNTRLDIKHGLNDYQDMFFKFSAFLPISDVIYAFSMNAEHRFNDVPDQLKIAFGNDNSIRGNDTFKREFGTHLFIVRQEFRYILFDDFKWSFNPPLVAKYFQKMSTSAYVFAYVDAGRLYKNTDDLFDLGQYKKGFGIGLGILFPYLDNLNAYIGTNPKGSYEFGFSLGAKF